MSHYIQYYENQIGGGRTGGIENVFYGSRRQRGNGIGGFLGGLFRMALPFIKSGAKAIGKEAFRAGVNMTDDVLSKGVNVKTAFKDRARESGTNLTRKASDKLIGLMNGNGYKTVRKSLRAQSKRSCGRVRKRMQQKRNGKKKKKVIKKSAKNKKKKRNSAKSKNKGFRSVRDIFGPR